MKEIKAIIRAYDNLHPELGIALATVVRVEGSSYRRTGARMLVAEDGTWVGGISGGCLEGDALKQARLAINNSRSTLITYDTTDDDPHQIGIGLGCNGVIDVLFTPLDRADPGNPVEMLKSCISETRTTHILITITGVNNISNLKAGDVIRYTDERDLAIISSGPIADDLALSIKQRIEDNHSAPFSLTHNGNILEGFIEILPPEINLILMGHQYDVYPMSRLLKELGWKVTVCGNISKLNSRVRDFTDEMISDEHFESLHTDKYTAVILMSHDYKTDKRNLLRAITTEASFIGMLGPRVRSEKIWDELSAAGHRLSAADLERIHAPVGLDIGAVTPEEIALSLASGVKAAFSGRDGTFLRQRPSPIHIRR